MPKIIISKKGREFGPFTLEVTRSMFLAGRFLANDRARTVGAKQWVSLIQIPGIAEAPHTQTQKSTPRSRRRGFVILALLIAVLAVWAGVEMFLRGNVDGKIFVTTHGGRIFGGRTYELGRVTVSLFPLNEFKEHLSRKNVQVNREFAGLKQAIEDAVAETNRTKNTEQEAREQWARNRSEPQLKLAMDEAISANRIAEDACAELLRKSAQYYDGACFFDQLPKTIASTQTDQGGHFSMKTPSKGDFAIAAKAQSPMNPAKAHCWMIPVFLNGKSRQSVVLSNENRISEDSPDSLVQAMK